MLMLAIQYNHLALIYAVATGITLAVSFYSISQYRTGTNVNPQLTLLFIGVVVSGTIWSGCRMFELLFVSELATRFWISSIYVGLGGGALSMCFFGLAFAGRDRFLNRRTVLISGLLPALFVLLAFTNDYYHQLLWTGEFVERSGWYGENIVFYNREFQPLFHLYITSAVTFASIGIFALLRVAISAPDVYRQQMIAFIAGSLIVIISATLFGFGEQPLVPQFFDLTPIGFAIMGVFFGYALFQPQVLNLVPVARDSVIDRMDDAYIVLDSEGRVVDSNPAARQLVDIEDDWTGMHGSEFFEPFSEQYGRFRDTDSVDTEINLQANGTDRYFDLKISPIDDEGSEQGTLVILREITQLKTRERELRDREAELDLLRQVQSRVLRHNIRNDLGVMRTYGEVFAEDLDDPHEEMAEKLVSTADDLLSVSNKARSVEKLVEQEQVPTVLDIDATLENLIEAHKKKFPEVTFSLNVPEECQVEAIPAMELAIDNLIENAAEHNESIEPSVDVSVQEDPETVTIRIADNGSGIPDHELEVLKEGEETDLKHGSGVGLWLVDWVRRNSDATILFNNSDEGAEVKIQIQS